MLSESGRCSWSFLGTVCSVMRRLQVFLPDKRKAPPLVRRVSHKVMRGEMGSGARQPILVFWHGPTFF